MDMALDLIGGLLDELKPRTQGTPDQAYERFVSALMQHSAFELRQYARSFEHLGAPPLAELCRAVACDKKARATNAFSLWEDDPE